jgi:hypothetical protein
MRTAHIENRFAAAQQPVLQPARRSDAVRAIAEHRYVRPVVRPVARQSVLVAAGTW